MENPNLAKNLARLLVDELDPSQADIVTDGFDAMAASGFPLPEEQPTRSFGLPPEAWPYALTLCTFIGGVFAGAAKDALKARLAELFKQWSARDLPLAEAEILQIAQAIQLQGKNLGVPDVHRKQLSSDLTRLLKQSPKVLLLSRD